MNKNYEYKKLTPFKWFVLQNFPFIDEDFDAITNYQLFCKLGEEINKLIESMNLAGTQVEELTDYVNNYFDNLDVQDEINNKLDEMAEDGTLEEIISEYINLKSILAYDTVSDMKQATNLIDGSFARTYGYATLNDKGGALYKVREVTNQDTVDEELLIALADEDLVAELIIEDCLVPEQIGAIGDGTNNVSTKFLHAMNIASSKNVPLQLVGRYVINNEINFSNGALNIRGSKSQIPSLLGDHQDSYSNIIIGSSGAIGVVGISNVTFENIAFTGNSAHNGILLRSFKNKIINCSFNDFDYAIRTMSGTNWVGENQIVNCNFLGCDICIKLDVGSDGDINGCLVPRKLQLLY